MSDAGFQSVGNLIQYLVHDRSNWLGLTRIEEDQSISSNEVETTPSCLGTEQEDDFWRIGIVELVD